jgi:hypothetical protein
VDIDLTHSREVKEVELRLNGAEAVYRGSMLKRGMASACGAGVLDVTKMWLRLQAALAFAIHKPPRINHLKTTTQQLHHHKKYKINQALSKPEISYK